MLEVPAGAVELGAIVPITLQYSPLSLPLAVAATISELVTVAPELGRPMAADWIVVPLSCAHKILEAESGGETVTWLLLDPPHAAIKAINPIANNRCQLNRIVELGLCMLISNSG